MAMIRLGSKAAKFTAPQRRPVAMPAPPKSADLKLGKVYKLAKPWEVSKYRTARSFPEGWEIVIDAYAGEEVLVHFDQGLRLLFRADVVRSYLYP